ncbi:MAG: hypothetical protein GWP91_10145 [Rhodobacterales bacterium]|nr:hypothetical protein [Rhodobacterales bacterium]
MARALGLGTPVGHTLEMEFQTLAPLRHECSSCGVCCNNVRVSFVDESEHQRIAGFAAEMGLSDAVDRERIIHQRGSCPFQTDGWKCRIHAAHGLMAKPLMCRVFPQVARYTEAGMRAGIDPTSRAFRTTRNTGPALDMVEIAAPAVMITDSQGQMESALVQALGEEGATLGGILATLCRAPLSGELPIGFGGRLVTYLKDSPLRALLEDPQCGPLNRAALLPVVDWLDAVEPDALEPWQLGADEDEYARDCVRATLYLRLYLPSFPDVYTGGLLTLVGLVLCAYPKPSPADYGAAVTSWLRLIRARSFWMRLFPNPQALAWLTGKGPFPT